MSQTKSFTFGYYFQTLTRLLGDPRKYFTEMSSETNLKGPLGFLLFSALIFTGASLMNAAYENPLIIGGIFFANAIGMVFVTAGLGYMVMVMTVGKQVTFIRFFSIYALSSGVTMLASWMPFFIWLTEPWKWWLIGTGMTRGFGFGWKQAIFIIGISLCVLVLFFWSLFPLISI